jgi:DNA modification methylase
MTKTRTKAPASRRATKDDRAKILDVLEGRSRWCVLEGDCLKLLRLLPPKRVLVPENRIIVVTDPPYGVGKKMNGDNLKWSRWLPWLDARLFECNRVAQRVFSFFAATRMVRFIRESKVPPQFEINWHKPMMLHDTSLNGSPFLAHRESILYWGPMTPKEAGKRGYDSFAVNAMWKHERIREGINHPTPKPFDLLFQTLRYWTDETDIVCDPFCGSGTHLHAALRLGRRVIGFDNDPQWVDLSRRRLTLETEGTSLRDQITGQTSLFGDKMSSPIRW